MGDTLIGDGADNLFEGREGNDSLSGGVGNDTLMGGTGIDNLQVGAGADILDGGTDGQADRYRLADGHGNGTITDGDNTGSLLTADGLTANVSATFTSNYTGTLLSSGDTVTFSGIVSLRTGDGDDLLDASNMTNDIYLSAGDGQNTVVGGAGTDDLRGGTGDDSLVGNDGNDYAETEGGADTINTGGGANTVYSGADADLIEVEDGFDGAEIFGGEGVTTGTDQDRIDFGAMTVGIALVYTDNEIGNVTAGMQALSFAEIEALTLTEQDDTVNATASTLGESLDGGGGNDSILGGTGGDTIAGGEGDDYIEGGDGDDVLMTGLGNDTVFGGIGNDTLMNSDGDDSLDGGAGDDSIVATGGEDTLRGGTGSDTMEGGDDADTFIIEDSFGNDVITGGEGTTDPGDEDFDTIDLSAMTGPVTVTYTGDEAGTITDGTDTITFSEIERIITTDQNDSINAVDDTSGSVLDARGGDDEILGGQGNDTIFGGSGRDTISDGMGDDSVDAGSGDDIIGGWQGNDTFDGGSGNDSIEGGDGADSIRGGTGDDLLVGYDAAGLGSGSTNVGTDDGSADTIEGGSGADTIAGGRGADSLSGGDDADTFIFQDNFGDDTITGGEGGTDNDVIDLSAMTGPVTVTYTGDEAGTITDGTDTITFTEIERVITTDQADVVNAAAQSGSGGIDVETRGGDDTVTGGNNADTIDAGDGNDSVDGGGAGDSIDGGAGNDTLDGGAGSDTIDGGDGADSIDGGAGNDLLGYAVGGDTIDGGAGDDTLRGGFTAGDDDAVLRGGDGNDSIVTYGANDTIEGNAGNDTINADSGDESIDGGADDDLIWANHGNDTVDGGTGDDTIEGGSGDDLITGGDGDDTFIYNAGDGFDTITDFNFGNSGALGDGDTTNNDFINLSSFYDNLTELREDFDDDGVLNQSNSTDNGGTVDYANNDTLAFGDGLTFQGANQSSFTADNTGVVCFAKGTMIETNNGQVPVEHLRVGDMVQTRDNGAKRILWCGYQALDAKKLATAPHLKPISLAASLFGTQQPLIVSPQHAILVCQDGEERLVRAKHLAAMEGGRARVMAGCRHVAYYHLMLEAHEILFANGAPAESFYPGPMAMHMLQPASRAAVYAALPGLRGNAVREVYGPPAVPFAKRRHLQGSRLLVAPAISTSFQDRATKTVRPIAKRPAAVLHA